MQLAMEKEVDFIDYFYGINFNDEELGKFKDYIRAHKLKSDNKIITISTKLDKHPTTVGNWLNKRNIPYSIKLLNYYKILGKPKYKNFKWIPINSTRGGLLTGTWVSVPDKIKDYKDIYRVIEQLPILPDSYKIAIKFNISKQKFKEIRPLFLAYILGIMIGDATKETIKRKYRTTRRITLRLTKRYKTNKTICEFLCLCLNSLGLRIKRNKDGSPSKKNTYYFYRYGSQCSSLVQWMFRTCLGLEDNECTTYNSIRARWLINTPRNFKIWFLQGVADSDGYLDIGALQIGLITKPNANIIEKIFDSLNIHYCRKYLEHGTLPAIMISVKDGAVLPIFNYYAKSHRYLLMEKLINSRRSRHHLPKNLSEEVNNYIFEGKSTIDIVKILLNKYNLLIRQSSILKRIRRFKRIGVL